MNTVAPLEIKFPLRPKPAPDNAHHPPQSTGRLPEVTRVLALAIHFDEMIRKGEAKDYADVARQTCLCRERVSQVARLNYLAPDIQMELLYLPAVPAGRYPISETAMRKIANHLSWVEQRREWIQVKALYHLD